MGISDTWPQGAATPRLRNSDIDVFPHTSWGDANRVTRICQHSLPSCVCAFRVVKRLKWARSFALQEQSFLLTTSMRRIVGAMHAQPDWHTWGESSRLETTLLWIPVSFFFFSNMVAWFSALREPDDFLFQVLEIGFWLCGRVAEPQPC